MSRNPENPNLLSPLRFSTLPKSNSQNPVNILTLTFLLEVEVLPYLLFKKLQRHIASLWPRLGELRFFLHGWSWFLVCRFLKLPLNSTRWWECTFLLALRKTPQSGSKILSPIKVPKVSVCWGQFSCSIQEVIIWGEYWGVPDMDPRYGLGLSTEHWALIMSHENTLWWPNASWASLVPRRSLLFPVVW